MVETAGGDVDKSQSITGSILIKNIADEYMGIPRIDVFTEKYEKPKGFIDSNEVSVSFSHTDSGLAASVSLEHNVGLDMEETGRNVHERLASRMRHPDEGDQLYKEHELIRIWTLKESALKMIGTGLRKPMNSVIIKQTDTGLFSVRFEDAREATICSFQHENHWVSICYHNNAVI